MTGTKSSVKIAKALLRKRISTRLSELNPTEITRQSCQIKEHILKWPVFLNGQRISCFLSMSTEVDTWPLAVEILRAGKYLYVPRIVPSKPGVMQMVRIYDEQDLENLPTSHFGIREPTELYGTHVREGADESETMPLLDLLFMPGVCFDRRMARLGHGKGYYDSYLAAYKAACDQQNASTFPCLLGVALREQLLELGEVPMAEHDWRVDTIVTPEGFTFTPDE